MTEKILKTVKNSECEHTYQETWEFGPIIIKKNDEKPYWWFYKKCSHCGKIVLFPSWKLTPGPRKNDCQPIDLFFTPSDNQQNKNPRLNLSL